MSLTGLVFLILFGGTLLLAIVRHPMYGIYAYLLAFYGYPEDRWWGADLPDLRWSLVAAAVTLVGTLRLEREPHRPAWFTNPVAISLIAFTGWLWVQSLWAISPSDHSYFVTIYAKYIVLFYLMHRLIDSEKAVMQFSMAHVVGCAYYGWIAYRTAGAGRFEDVGGPNMDGASAFAAQLSTGLIFAGVLLFRLHGALRLLAFLSIPIILNALILTQSRGGFLGIIAGGLAVVYLAPIARRRAFYLAGGLSIVLFGILAHDTFWNRMGTIVQAVEQEESMDTSAESRWLLLDAQWEMFKRHPIIGTGHRGTVELSPRYLDARWLSGGGRASHNTWMSLLVEQGIVGTLIYGALAVWAVRQLLRMRSIDRAGLTDTFGMHRAALGGALASVFVSGQFADLLRLEVTIWCLVLLIAVSRLSFRSVQNTDQST